MTERWRAPSWGLLQHRAPVGIGDGWRRGDAQPDCPSDGLVPESVAGGGKLGVLRGVVKGFTATQRTVEQVEAESDDRQQERA